MKKKHTTAIAAFLILAALTGFITKIEAQTLLPIKVYLWPGSTSPDATSIMTDILEELQNPYQVTIEQYTLTGNEFTVTTSAGTTLANARNWCLSQGWNCDTVIHWFIFSDSTFNDFGGLTRTRGYRGTGNDYNRAVLVAQNSSASPNGINGVAKHETLHCMGRPGHTANETCPNSPPNAGVMSKFSCEMNIDSSSVLLVASHLGIQLLTECSYFSVDCDVATMTLPRQFSCDEILLEFSTDGGNTWTTTDTIVGDGTSFTQTTKTVNLTNQPPNYSLWRIRQLPANYQIGPVVQTTCLVLPLQLISFDGEAYEPAVNKLEWVTLNEENMVEFQLDYSDDATNFQTAMTVAATGDGTYVEYHELGRSGGMYYRLTSIDINGPCDTSDVIYISNMLTGTTEQFPPEFRLYPNPAANHISCTNWGSATKVEIYNMLGQQVLATTLNQNTIQVESLTTGLYVLRGYGNSGDLKGVGRFSKQ